MNEYIVPSDEAESHVAAYYSERGELLAFIEQGRLAGDFWPPALVDIHNILLDALKDLAARHYEGSPFHEPNGGLEVTECEHCGMYWPCPDYDTVMDAMRRMGVNV